MTDKPVECSVPVHDWEQISHDTVLTMIIGKHAPGDVSISVFRCTRCKLLKFFSNK